MKKLIVLIGFIYIVSARSDVFFCKLIDTNIDSFSQNGRPVFGHIEFDTENDFLKLTLQEAQNRSCSARTFERKCFDILTPASKYVYYSCEVNDEWRWNETVGKMKIENSRFSYPKDTFLMTFEDSEIGSSPYDFKTREKTLRRFYCKKNDRSPL